MLTRLSVTNFKALRTAEIELAERVVFIGPNNSGKTTALQALSLWRLGLTRFLERRGGKPMPERRAGVLINRRDIVAIPVPTLDQLWSDKKLRRVLRIEKTPRTNNIMLAITVRGVTRGVEWECGFEFNFRDDESIYVKPIAGPNGQRVPVPEEAKEYKIAILPPMSGLTANERRLDLGAIDTLIGEGRTAEVLRNLCYLVATGANGREAWARLKSRIKELFSVELNEPTYIAARGEIEMTYEENRVSLDIAAAGRGLQQTLLLLAHMEVHPKSVLLLDEPDAHLEIVRQQEIYDLLTQYAATQESQLVIASHSEVVLRQAASKDVVIAFVGQPHRINDHGMKQVLKALAKIGASDYYLAALKQRVLYLEGSTDLAILQALARLLHHDALKALEQPFMLPVANQPSKAENHYYGLREAVPSLKGYAVYDRLDKQPKTNENLQQRMWRKREIENYLLSEGVLKRWAFWAGSRESGGDLMGHAWEKVMGDSIAEVVAANRTLGRDPFGDDIKASDEVLTPIFEAFFVRLGIANLMRKTNFHVLADFLQPEDVAPEIVSVLDEIALWGRVTAVEDPALADIPEPI